MELLEVKLGASQYVAATSVLARFSREQDKLMSPPGSSAVRKYIQFHSLVLSGWITTSHVRFPW